MYCGIYVPVIKYSTQDLYENPKYQDGIIELILMF